MKFRYLGTAAAEGVPGIFCTCENCKRARHIGGRAIRTRSQAVIDDRILIDFPADTYDHCIRLGLDLSLCEACIVTHRHSDHLYPADLELLIPGFSHMPEGYHLAFFGSTPVLEALRPEVDRPALAKSGLVSLTEITPFVPFRVGNYEITPLPAVHDAKSGAVIYMISDGEKTVLYGNDTDYFSEEVWEYFAKVSPKFDLVSLDCTNGLKPMDYVGHMNLELNAKIRCRMLENGYADEKTRFVCQHFSHNAPGALYDDMLPYAAKEGFAVAYDGLEIEI